MLLVLRIIIILIVFNSFVLDSKMAMMLSVAATRRPLIGCGVRHCSTLPPKSGKLCPDHRTCQICVKLVGSTTFIGFRQAGMFYVAHNSCYDKQRYYLRDDVTSTCMVCTNVADYINFTADGCQQLCKDHNRCATCNLQFPSRRESQPNTCQCIDGRPAYPRHCFDICQYAECDRVRGRNWYCEDHKNCRLCVELVTKEQPGIMKETYRLRKVDNEKKYMIEVKDTFWYHESCCIETKFPIAGFFCCICDNASDYCIRYEGYLRFVCRFHSNCRICTLCLPLSSHHVQSPLDKDMCSCDQPLVLPPIGRILHTLPDLIRQYNYTDAMKQFFLDAIHESQSTALNELYETCGIPLKRHVSDELCDKSVKRIKTQARIMQCAICLEPMSRPRSLPCGHLFCDGCLTHQDKVHKDTLQANRVEYEALRLAVQAETEELTHEADRLELLNNIERARMDQQSDDRFLRAIGEAQLISAERALQQHDEEYPRPPNIGEPELIDDPDEESIVLACATCRTPYSSEEIRNIYINWL